MSTVHNGHYAELYIMAESVSSPQRPLAATGAALPFQSKCNSRGRLVAEITRWRPAPVEIPVSGSFFKTRIVTFDPYA
jgi:hypothetical protein